MRKLVKAQADSEASIKAGSAVPNPRARNDPSEGRSRAEFAYDQLKARLRSGELKAGQRLREAELAETLNVSRTPVREALRRIASDGLVQVVAGRGLIVAEFHQRQVRELYALRALLEGGAAMLAAQLASSSDLAMMKELLDASEAVTDSPAQTATLNARFHRVIHEAARNRYLEQALAQMSDSLALLPGTTFSEPGRAEVALREHRAILNALVRRDPERAERVAREHIEKAGAARIRMMFA
jgi:DNA-binding GntR family transcriptional regulator